MIKNVFKTNLFSLKYFNSVSNSDIRKTFNLFKYTLTQKHFSKVNGGLISLDFDQGNLFETTACNIAMSRNKNIKRKYFSFDLINDKKRGVIEEASRILREDVEDITQLNSNRLDVCY